MGCLELPENALKEAILMLKNIRDLSAILRVFAAVHVPRTGERQRAFAAASPDQAVIAL